MVLSLDVPPTPLENSSSPYVCRSAFLIGHSNVVTVHRFEELINGREYLIEVSEVSADRWRAQIARLPGGSSALMPFYGTTPADAAQRLAAWLSRAHRQAANPV